MSEPITDRKRLYLNVLPEYEMKLLGALAFFLNRKIASQAAAALAMYLRQSQERILAQVDYYAAQLGTDRWQLLDAISDDPDAVRKALDARLGGLHKGESDVFSADEDS
jgi:hypothetical protein